MQVIEVEKHRMGAINNMERKLKKQQNIEPK